MLDRFLVEHCSPTLAGLKAANLFRYNFSSEEELKEQLTQLSVLLNGKGVFFEVIMRYDKSALILAYRKKKLQANLKKEEVAEFLASYGYAETSLEACLSRLKERFSRYGIFPHEIGVFMGYPLEDVIDFIRHEGKNCKCTGCWKVYHNEGEAEKQFRKFQRCKDVYMQLFSVGRSIMQLTVAA
jgi:hypothetical protein